MPLPLKQLAPIALTLVLLTSVWALVPLQVKKVGAAEFHARSRAAVEAIPLTIDSPSGPWVATRVPLEARSAGLLQPNVERDLRFINQPPGKPPRGAALSVIQVADARTMAGHAPVNCYPGTGWTITNTERKQFKFKDIELKPAVYTMFRDGKDGMRTQVVYDLFIFPDGRDGTTLEEIDRFAQDYRKMKYGITHIQVVTFDSKMTNKERDEIFSILVGSESCLKMVRVMRTGIPYEQ